MKKVLSIVLSLVMVLCMTPMMAFADTSDNGYSDIAGEKCEGAVNVLSALGVIDGYEDGTYRPDTTISRAELTKIVVTALGVADYASATTSSYTDMANAQWAVPYVEYAKNLNLVEGYGNGKFGPSDPITYEQAATLIVRAIGYTTECNEMNGSWPAIYIQKATALGIFKNVEGSQYGTGATRGDVAVMLYNALDIPQVYADKDGATLNKRGEAYTDVNGVTQYSYITMMSTLNKDGSAEYGILSSADVDGATADVRSYIGAAAKITKDKNGDVIALGDIKTTFLTGKYNSDNTFTVSDTDYICHPKYKTISERGVTGNATNAVEIKNGITKATTTLTAGETYTIACTVEGKTITGIYSIATWKADDAKKVASSDLTPVSKNKKLLGYAFQKDTNGDIDTNSFILEGVDSLDKIAEDNIVAVYTDGAASSPYITKVSVGTEVVTGEITQKYTDKITVDGTRYEFSTLKGTITIADEMFAAGNEVKLFLDYSGKIYAAELVNGMAGNYAVVIDATNLDENENIGTGLNSTALKVKMILADGTVKTFDVDASKLEDNGVDKTKWNNLDSKDLVTYELNSSDQIVNIAEVTGLDTGNTDLKVSSSGYYDGYAIADNAAIFKLPETASTKDSDYSVISKSSLAGTSKVTADYKLNKAGTQIAAMTISKSSDTTELYGIFNSSYTNADKDTCVNGFIGSEALNDAVINSGTYAADTLFKITKTGSGEYDIVSVDADNKGAAIKGENVSTKDNALYNGATRVKAFASDVVVYAYDDKAEEYVVGTLSDIDAADANDDIYYYCTEDDTTKDNYGMITYVIVK